MSIARMVAEGDISLYRYIGSQTSEADRRSLLSIHNALAQRAATFSYVEIGSHLGGTLQAFIADPRCRRIVSIDPRPPAQPDDRGPMFAYEGNSTARMRTLLARVPGADMAKLETVELSTENIAPGRLARPDLCVIDGEHTYAAALRDARFCRAAMQGAGVILFHDREVIEPAILDFLRETTGPVTAYALRGSFFVIELGADPPLLHEAGVKANLGPPHPLVWEVAGRLRVSGPLVEAAGHVRRLRRRL
jgi:hypothetical protein